MNNAIVGDKINVANNYAEQMTKYYHSQIIE